MIKITQSAKDKQYYVTIIAKNGKILCVSEGFKKVSSALKNVAATGKAFDGIIPDVKFGKIKFRFDYLNKKWREV